MDSHYRQPLHSHKMVGEYNLALTDHHRVKFVDQSGEMRSLDMNSGNVVVIDPFIKHTIVNTSDQIIINATAKPIPDDRIFKGSPTSVHIKEEPYLLNSIVHDEQWGTIKKYPIHLVASDQLIKNQQTSQYDLEMITINPNQSAVFEPNQENKIRELFVMTSGGKANVKYNDASLKMRFMDSILVQSDSFQIENSSSDTPIQFYHIRINEVRGSIPKEMMKKKLIFEGLLIWFLNKFPFKIKVNQNIPLYFYKKFEQEIVTQTEQNNQKDINDPKSSLVSNNNVGGIDFNSEALSINMSHNNPMVYPKYRKNSYDTLYNKNLYPHIQKWITMSPLEVQLEYGVSNSERYE